MLARIDRFSELVGNLNESDRDPLRPDELQTLISMAEMLGYTVEKACDLKAQQDEVSSELYAVWYAKEKEVHILADNIAHLIKLTGWGRLKTPDIETCIQHDIQVSRVA